MVTRPTSRVARDRPLSLSKHVDPVLYDGVGDEQARLRLERPHQADRSVLGQFAATERECDNADRTVNVDVLHLRGLSRRQVVGKEDGVTVSRNGQGGGLSLVQSRFELLFVLGDDGLEIEIREPLGESASFQFVVNGLGDE